MDVFVIYLMGVMSYLVIVWALFADFIALLLKIFPMKPPKDYNEYCKNRNSQEFKCHKKKWIKSYTSLLIIYTLVFYGFWFFTKNLGNSFLFSFFILVIGMGILNNFERKERPNK